MQWDTYLIHQNTTFVSVWVSGYDQYESFVSVDLIFGRQILYHDVTKTPQIVFDQKCFKLPSHFEQKPCSMFNDKICCLHKDIIILLNNETFVEFCKI